MYEECYLLKKSILLLSGCEGSGKTSLAQMFVDRADSLFPLSSGTAVRVLSFADPLKELVSTHFDIPRADLWGSNSDKNVLTRVRWQDLPHYDVLSRRAWKEGEEPPHIVHGEFLTVRQLLREVGTNIVRKMNPDAYVDIGYRTASCHLKDDGANLVIFDDVRFLNEVGAGITNGALLVGVRRKGKEPTEEGIGDGYDRIFELADAILDVEENELEQAYTQLCRFLLWKGVIQWMPKS